MFSRPYSGIIEINEEEEPVSQVFGYESDVETANKPVEVFEDDSINVYEEEPLNVFEEEISVYNPVSEKKKNPVEKKIKKLKKKMANKK